jgi:quercetin dioxygenase-like cupin family protein
MSQTATRMIAAAALIVAIGLGLHVARAQQPASKRTDLQRHDVSGSGGEAARAIVEVSLADEQTATGTEGAKEKVRSHQPGQDAFRAIRAEDLDWQPFAAFPPSVRLAVVVGQPLEKGPYTIRVKVPRGVKLMPHKHPEDRVYTVISGVFYIGLGDQFDADKLEAYAPGTVIVLPGNTSHFHWAKAGEYITQVTGVGPLGIEYVNPKDDPRNGRSGV